MKLYRIYGSYSFYVFKINVNLLDFNQDQNIKLEILECN